ncbi:hypothetical protein [uncultured Pontibacter sp.]|uniref:hypothetical protein n=1 Tax=uncultured Pontibacter sp. TaxID=453356 RepID=UPI00262B57CD|nr:hypothetical protein [uncultured Pontibacter sp.]
MKVAITNFFAVLALLLFCAACDTTEEVLPEAVPVDKSVVFEIFGNQDFSYSRYGDEQVLVELLIRRVNKLTKEETVVFDTSFTSALKDIPVRGKKLQLTKTVPAVQDKKENIFIGSGYTVMQSSFGKSETLPSDLQEKKVQLIIY